MRHSPWKYAFPGCCNRVNRTHHKILEAAHSSWVVGHTGVDKTLSRVQSKFWWPEPGFFLKKYALVANLVAAC